MGDPRTAGDLGTEQSPEPPGPRGGEANVDGLQLGPRKVREAACPTNRHLEIADVVDQSNFLGLRASPHTAL
jgi:hypothetical protein